MDLSEPLINKVAESGLITIDLETYVHPGERIVFDIKDWLFREMILKEKEFRASVSTHDWSQYTGKNLAFTCSSEAIVPTWAYMLLAIAAEPFVNRYVFGSLEALESVLIQDALNKLDLPALEGKRVIVKGCGDRELSPGTYVEITHRLLPHVKSIMYGEACSNVPLFKRK